MLLAQSFVCSKASLLVKEFPRAFKYLFAVGVFSVFPGSDGVAGDGVCGGKGDVGLGVGVDEVANDGHGDAHFAGSAFADADAAASFEDEDDAAFVDASDADAGKEFVFVCEDVSGVVDGLEFVEVDGVG